MPTADHVARPVLVTGAAGFAGSHLIELLLAEDRPVVAWSRPGERRPLISWPAAGGDGDPASRLQWVDVEMLDRRAVGEAVASCRPQTIYHFAAAAHVGLSWVNVYDTFRLNVVCTHHLIEAVRSTVPDARVLVTGSALVYRQSTEALSEDHPIGPDSPYGLSKLAQELVVLRAAAEGSAQTVLARSFNHLGPRQHPGFAASSFARQIVQIERGGVAPVLYVGNLEARRDLTDVRDTVRAYRLLAERGVPGRPYNVCSGRAYAVREVLDGLLAHSAVAVDVEVDPSRLRPSDNLLLLGDPSRIRSELGWSPTIPLDRTLGDLLEYWRGTE